MDHTKLVTIQRLSKKGLGIGFCEDLSKDVEVRGVYPTEKVLCTLSKKKKGFHQGVAIQIVEESKSRCEKKCVHFPTCGGCSWQTLSYDETLNIKQQLVENLFSGLCDQNTIKQIIGIEFPWEFRNKMEWSFYDENDGLGKLGLIEAGSKGRVFDVRECFLCPEWMVDCLKATRDWWEKNSHVRAYHILRKTGTLHLLTMREAKNTKEKMVILTVCGEPSSFRREELESFKKTIIDVCGDDVSLFLAIKHIQEGRATSINEMLLHGKDHILETLNVRLNEEDKKFSFKISPASFFQPNTKQAELIYSLALQMLANQNLNVVLDLYSGTGTLGIAFSSLANKVIAVELNPYATFDAAVNMEMNHVTNMTMIQGDVKEVIEKNLIQEQVDLVIVDPPRSGLGEKVCRQIQAFKPKLILYISCNPTTQAEDMKFLVSSGYKIDCVQPVDQFAHSFHLENMVVLKREDA